MSKARDTILAAVRHGLKGLGPAGDPRAEAAALLADLDAVRPQAPALDTLGLFIEKVVTPPRAATLDQVDGLAEVPGAVARYLESEALPPSIAVQPRGELTTLDWSGIETHRSIDPNETVGLALARFAVAETGSLVFHSGPDDPILLDFLPLHHVVVVKASSVLRYLDDYAAAAAKLGTPPRNAVFVTGVSGTTDIEGSYVRGAHGPRFLHVILVRDDA